MELRQLKYFVKAAETLNFSEAARKLFITQSTLSQQIRQLENELGVELFTRDSHSVKLTESGEHLLPNAVTTLQDADSCLMRISDLKQMLSGVLNIGITYSFIPILTETVKEFTRQHSGVKLNIICGNMEDTLELLKKREVDFVLCYKPDYVDDEIESHVLFDDNLAAIMRSDHPLAHKESLSLDDIRPYKIVLGGQSTQARNAFDRAFPGQDKKLNIHVEINDVQVLLDLVKATHMITFLSVSTLYKTEGLKDVPLEGKSTRMEGCVHALKNVYRKRAADEFIRILSQSNAVMVRANNWLK